MPCKKPSRITPYGKHARNRLGMSTIVFGPLKHRNFRLLLTGWVLGSTAAWVYQVVSMWLIFELTNSPLMLGFTGLFISIPFILTSLYAGVLSDYMDRRKVLLISQGLLTALATVPAVLAALDVIQVWHLYALSFTYAVLGGFDSPARQALVPLLVPQEQLMSATAMTSGVHRVTALFGPALGGFGMFLAGPSGALFFYALLQAIAFLNLLLMKTTARASRSQRSSLGRSILEGLQTVRGNRILLGTLTLSAVHTFFVTSQALMPVFARDILKVGPTGLGLLYSSSGLGAVFGSAFIVMMGDVRKKGRLLFLSDFSKPLALVLFALSTWMPVSMILLIYTGLFDIVGNAVRTTVLQLSTEDRVRGRVMAMNTMVNRGLGPLSSLQSGVLASLMGAPAAIATGSFLFVIFGVFFFLLVPEVYRFQKETTEGGGASTT